MPVVFAFKAEFPTAVLLEAVELAPKELCPIAVLSPPVVFASKE